MSWVLVIWCCGRVCGARLLELAENALSLGCRVWGLVDELPCLDWGPLVPIMVVSKIEFENYKNECSPLNPNAESKKHT
jgi:hypothetical protein